MGPTAVAVAEGIGLADESVRALATAVGGAGSDGGFMGGDGGAATAAARASSNGFGPAYATAIVRGGDAGLGQWGRGRAADVSLTNAVSGSSGMFVYLTQEAVGGAAGDQPTGRAGVPGNAGGRASSTLNVVDTRAQGLYASIRALGGDGGRGSTVDAPNGAGGDAVAQVKLQKTHRYGSANASVSAQGGAGPGRRGRAEAIADVSFNNEASAAVQANGWEPRAMARVTTLEGNRWVQVNGFAGSEDGHAPAVVLRAGHVYISDREVVVPRRTDDVVVFSNVFPGSTEFSRVLERHRRVTAGLPDDINMLGMASLLVGHDPAENVTSRSVGITFGFELTAEREVWLGLLDSAGEVEAGDEFGSLQLDLYTDNGMKSLLSRDFTSLGAVLSFFNDRPLSLGTFAAGASDVSLRVSSSSAGDRWLGLSYLMVDGAPTPPVAEPTMTCLLMSGVLLMALLRRGTVYRSRRRSA